jgi:hypothetical protein
MYSSNNHAQTRRLILVPYFIYFKFALLIMIQKTTATNKKDTDKVPELKEKEEEAVYNNKTEQSYNKKLLNVPERLDYQEKNFLSEVDTSKGEIEKQVNTIVRIMAIDHDDPKKKRKEFMYWYENWRGKNWQGQSVPPVTDHVEGIYYEQDTEPIIERNRKVGDRRVGQHEVFYIPFSKEKVDELVEMSVGTEKETINYVVKTPTIRGGGYTYEQFVSSTFPEAVQMLMKNGGPQLVAMEKQQQQQKQSEEKKEDKEEEVKPLDDTEEITSSSTPKPVPPTPPKYPPQQQPQPHLSKEKDTRS